MINASNNFINAIEGTSRQFRARLMNNGTPLDCDIGKIICHKGSCGDEMSIGCVYASYMDVTLRRCNTNVDGMTLVYQIGVNTGNNTYEYIDVGKFIVVDPSTANGTTTFSAISTLGQIGNNAYSSSITYPTTISAVINELASTVASLSGASIQYKGYTSADISGAVEEPITGQIRDVLSTIGCLLGGFITEDNAGNIVISKFNAGGTASILPHRSLELPEIRETPFQTLGVHITVKDATQDEEGQVIPEVYFEYGSPVIFQTNAWMTQAVFNRMVSHFVGMTFDLATVDISLGDPRLEAWDKITLTDLAGHTFNIPCFELTHTFDGGFSTTVSAVVASVGTSTKRVKGALEKYVERLDSEIYAAETAAIQAKQSAVSAQESAESAQDSAASALDSASEAINSAYVARTSAESAQSDADTAYMQASSATASAGYALGHLAELESVLDVLNWVSTHGSYALTQDTETLDGKWYFDADGTVTSPEPNPYLQGWYELNTYTFTLSEDEIVDVEKVYYQRSEAAPYTYSAVIRPSGNPVEYGWYELTSATYTQSADTSMIGNKLYFTFDGQDYNVITNPVANPSALGLYELDSVDEAMSAYISTHLALTNDGLYVQMNESSARLQVSATGVTLWDNEGQKIAQYTDSVILGNEGGVHIHLSAEHGLGFYRGLEDDNDPSVNRVAYISGNKLFITEAEITNNLRIGSFIWTVQSTSRISLRYSPTT